MIFTKIENAKLGLSFPGYKFLGWINGGMTIGDVVIHNFVIYVVNQ